MSGLWTFETMPTILIADDEARVVELVRVTLEDQRTWVVEAGDGATALALAAALEPDLILLGARLPDMSGIEVCRLLRREPCLADTRIVILTPAVQPDDVARALAAGATRYLAKPLSPVRLLSMVEGLRPRR